MSTIRRRKCGQSVNCFSATLPIPEPMRTRACEISAIRVRGRRSERRDIVNNRNTRTILSSTISNQRVTFNSARTTSKFTATCTFTERLTATGVVQTADGTCDLDLVYRDYRWWLCESSYHGLNEAGLRFIF